MKRDFILSLSCQRLFLSCLYNIHVFYLVQSENSLDRAAEIARVMHCAAFCNATPCDNELCELVSFVVVIRDFGSVLPI